MSNLLSISFICITYALFSNLNTVKLAGAMWNVPQNLEGVILSVL